MLLFHFPNIRRVFFFKQTPQSLELYMYATQNWNWENREKAKEENLTHRPLAIFIHNNITSILWGKSFNKIKTTTRESHKITSTENDKNKSFFHHMFRLSKLLHSEESDKERERECETALQSIEWKALFILSEIFEACACYMSKSDNCMK